MPTSFRLATQLAAEDIAAAGAAPTGLAALAVPAAPKGVAEADLLAHRAWPGVQMFANFKRKGKRIINALSKYNIWPEYNNGRSMRCRR